MSPKIKKLLSHPHYTTAKEAEKENEPHKKIKVEVIDVNNMDICDPTPSDSVWIKFKGMKADKDVIISGKTLPDLHINVAQELLKRQFPYISGLQSTLLLFEMPESYSHSSTCPNYPLSWKSLGCCLEHWMSCT